MAKKFRIFIYLISTIFFVCIAVNFFWVYLNWNRSKSDILATLASYKTQLDTFRNPISEETLVGEVHTGAVALPTKIYDRNSFLIGEFYAERRSLLPAEKMPHYLKDALISSEDRDFYTHKGINYSALFRAFIKNFISFRFAQGGSTITQQLAKVLFTNQKKTLSRKIFEYFCTREIEGRYTKDEILEMYLNLVYMGHGNYGIDSASRHYFNKTATQLTLAEAAMIIGILPNPNNFSPISNLKTALNRQKLVLNAMLQTRMLSEEKIEPSLKKFYQNWNIKKNQNQFESNIGNFPDHSFHVNLAPYFLNHIRQLLLEHFSNEVITKGGLKVYTTLDYKRQLIAKSAIKTAIERQKTYYINRGRNDTQNAEQWGKNAEGTNGVFITIEPQTGYILSMVGGYEFTHKNQFNRALLAKRQIGSLMKTFVFYQAISQKILTPATLIEDKPTKIGKFSFRNYDRKYLGKITAYDALRKSRNTTAIQILQMAGINELRQTFADLLALPYPKVQKRIPQEIGIALGTPSMTPLEVAYTYSTLVNQGRRIEPQYLLRVEDPFGNIIFENETIEVSILDPVACYIILSMLKGTLEEGGTAGWVNSVLNSEEATKFDAAGKTGTTSNYKDAWFVGLLQDEVSVIWIGNDQNKSLGSGRSGGSISVTPWVDYVRQVIKYKAPKSFLTNWNLEGVSYQSFCTDSGAIPRGLETCPKIIENQIFFEGTDPQFYDTRESKEQNLFSP